MSSFDVDSVSLFVERVFPLLFEEPYYPGTAFWGGFGAEWCRSCLMKAAAEDPDWLSFAADPVRVRSAVEASGVGGSWSWGFGVGGFDPWVEGVGSLSVAEEHRLSDAVRDAVWGDSSFGSPYPIFWEDLGDAETYCLNGNDPEMSWFCFGCDVLLYGVRFCGLGDADEGDECSFTDVAFDPWGKIPGFVWGCYSHAREFWFEERARVFELDGLDAEAARVAAVLDVGDRACV